MISQTKASSLNIIRSCKWHCYVEELSDEQYGKASRALRFPSLVSLGQQSRSYLSIRGELLRNSLFSRISIKLKQFLILERKRKNNIRCCRLGKTNEHFINRVPSHITSWVFSCWLIDLDFKTGRKKRGN